MPGDLNKMLSDIRGKTSKVQKEVRKLLSEYENLHREARRIFLQEQVRVGGTDGLEEFRYLNQLLKRNRDIVMSMVKASNNIRATEQFSFLEEDEELPVEKKGEVPEINPDMIENLNVEEKVDA
jgi:hypothetical protein